MSGECKASPHPQQRDRHPLGVSQVRVLLPIATKKSPNRKCLPVIEVTAPERHCPPKPKFTQGGPNDSRHAHPTPGSLSDEHLGQTTDHGPPVTVSQRSGPARRSNTGHGPAQWAIVTSPRGEATWLSSQPEDHTLAQTRPYALRQCQRSLPGAGWQGDRHRADMPICEKGQRRKGKGFTSARCTRGAGTLPEPVSVLGPHQPCWQERGVEVEKLIPARPRDIRDIRRPSPDCLRAHRGPPTSRSKS